MCVCVCVCSRHTTLAGLLLKVCWHCVVVCRPLACGCLAIFAEACIKDKPYSDKGLSTGDVHRAHGLGMQLAPQMRHKAIPRHALTMQVTCGYRGLDEIQKSLALNDLDLNGVMFFSCRCDGSTHGAALSSPCAGFIGNRSRLSGASRGALQAHGKDFADTCNGFPKSYTLNPKSNLNMRMTLPAHVRDNARTSL